MSWFGLYSIVLVKRGRVTLGLRLRLGLGFVVLLFPFFRFSAQLVFLLVVFSGVCFSPLAFWLLPLLLASLDFPWFHLLFLGIRW